MAVIIRLTRAGSKKVPFYRVVAADRRSPRDGRFIEQLGVYDPLRDPVEFRVNEDAPRPLDQERRRAQPDGGRAASPAAPRRRRGREGVVPSVV